jgi:hypothetical protein
MLLSFDDVGPLSASVAYLQTRTVVSAAVSDFGPSGYRTSMLQQTYPVLLMVTVQIQYLQRLPVHHPSSKHATQVGQR